MKTKLFSVAAAAFLMTTSMLINAQQFQPMAIASGLNADVIANGVGSASTSTNNDVDGVGYAFMARNFQATSTAPVLTYGLPNDGMISSAVSSTPGLMYQMASYTGNNAMRLATVNASGTATFTTPKALKNIYMLATSGSGDSTVNATINFTDGTTQAFTAIPVTDWYGGTNYAIQGIGRVTIATNSVDAAGGTNPRLYQIAMAISTANQAKLVQSVTVTKVGPTTGTGEIPNIFAFTGEVNNSCPMPTNVTTASTMAGANVNWTAPSTAPSAGYQYYVSTSSAYPASTVTPTGSTAAGVTTATLSGLTLGQTYYFWVRSNCGGSSQSFWTMASFTVGQISATYTTGDIATTYVDSSSITTATTTTCPGTLSITVPAGYKISSTNVVYNMTAVGLGYKEEQRSFITCTTNSVTEATVTSGTGATSGTQSYNRDITIANDLTGTVNFQLKAFRTYSSGACTTTINKVDNNTWKVTVTLAPINLATTETAATAKERIVYPNPFTDVLNIQKADKVKRATVTDMSGITVRTFENPASAIHLEGVKTGVYILTLDMKDGSKVSTKVIKK